jgi:hypothetical protein
VVVTVGGKGLKWKRWGKEKGTEEIVVRLEWHVMVWWLWFNVEWSGEREREHIKEKGTGNWGSEIACLIVRLNARYLYQCGV